MILTALLAVFSTSLLSVFTISQYQSVLIEKTFDVCRNLSINLSRVAREELLLNDIYDNTRTAVGGLRDSQISGLRRSYVIYRDGTIVADTSAERIGTRISPAEQSYYEKIQRLERSTEDVDGATMIRFADPISLRYEGERIRLGVSVFEFDRGEIFAPVNQVRTSVIVISIILIFVSVIVAFFLARRLSRPIDALARAAARIQSGETGIQVPVASNDEIGQLTRTFNAMSAHLKENERVQTRQAAVRREFEIAQGIQLSLLPKDQTYGPYEFLGSMQTADTVGGDYFDCLEIRNERKKIWWFLIADASGHGFAAGLTALMAQTAIHTALHLRPDLLPDQAFAAVNRVLYQNIQKLKQRRYLTGAFYRADAAGNWMVSGLHLDTLIYRAAKREVEVLESDGMWLGVEPDIAGDLRRQRFRLRRSDVLLLYTDGIIESMNPRGEMFGEERLRAALSAAPDAALVAIRDNILSEVRRFTRGAPLEDDLSFALIRKTK